MALVYLVHLLFLLLLAGVRVGHAECRVEKCRDSGPEIHYPFWLKDRQPRDCGHPYFGFELSCSQSNDTLLQLPSSVNVSVMEIDYDAMLMRVLRRDGCFRPAISYINISASAAPFQLLISPDNHFPEHNDNYYYHSNYYYYYHNHYHFPFSIFNCSSKRDDSVLIPITCFIDGLIQQVYAVYSEFWVGNLPLTSCTKMYNSSLPFSQLIQQANGFQLNWSAPLCSSCYDQGKQYCRLQNNKTECFSKGSELFKKGIPGLVSGLVLMAVLVISALYHFISLEKRKKEDEEKIKKFLEDYKALKPTRYSYTDMKRITNQFKEKLGQGGYGTVYKGNLSSDVVVAVKVLNFSGGNGEEFINEVATMGRIHHVNVVRLVGYCADGYRRALVYEFLPNDSLEKFIPSENKRHALSWEKLQHIALGIAKGIDYLHQGCDQRILHFDIKPHNVLLDHNFNPKISDFGLAKLCSKDQSAVSMTAARGTKGYIAPEVFSRNFGNVSYKSDVYSFGMLLLEMVGVKNGHAIEGDNSSQAYFPEWIYNRLNRGEELGIEIEEGDGNGDGNNKKIAEKLTVVGLWCIQWYPVNRPTMKTVIQMLQGEGSLTMPPNPFGNTNSRKTSASMHERMFNSELEAISESQ